MAEFDPTLSQVTDIQRAFDTENFTGADTTEGKRWHVRKHLGKLVGKYAGAVEARDHGSAYGMLTRSDVAPDLLVYAAQLADTESISLADVSGWGDPKLSELREIPDFALSGIFGIEAAVAFEGIEARIGETYGIFSSMRISDITDGSYDHGVMQDEIIPSLLSAAVDLSNFHGEILADLYQKRLIAVAERNGTGEASARRALDVISNQ
ncbi:MAG: hypothetical protein WC498_01470 [Candidatus Saccharimonadales bacterium]